MCCMNEPNEIELSKSLLQSADHYMTIMKSYKNEVTRAKGGPRDIPSVVCFRYEIPEGENVDAEGWGDPFVKGDEMGRFVAIEHDGIRLVEDSASLSNYAGSERQPGEALLDLLTAFLEKRKVMPYHVALLSDSISPKADMDAQKQRKFLEWRAQNEDKTSHELFVEDPFASEYLTEALTVFVMNKFGGMAKCITRYGYRDDHKPPKPNYEKNDLEYMGLIKDKNADFINQQRIVKGMLLFYAMCETLVETGDYRHG